MFSTIGSVALVSLCGTLRIKILVFQNRNCKLFDPLFNTAFFKANHPCCINQYVFCDSTVTHNTAILLIVLEEMMPDYDLE